MQGEDSPAFPTAGGYSSPVPAIVWSAADTVNGTPVNGNTPEDRQNSNYTPIWRTVADIFGWSWGLFSMQVAWGSFVGAFIDPSGLFTASVGLAAAVVALILAFVCLSNSSIYLVFTTLAVAALSVGVDVVAFLKKGGTQMPAVGMNVMTATGDGAAFAILLAENAEIP
jgi:hypothetical protein